MKWLWQVREWNCITLLEFDKVFKRGVEINSARNQKFETSFVILQLVQKN